MAEAVKDYQKLGKVLKVGDANGVKNGYLGIREGYEAGLNA